MKCCKVDVRATNKSYEQIIFKTKTLQIKQQKMCMWCKVKKVKVKLPRSKTYPKVINPENSLTRGKREGAGPLGFTIYCVVNYGFFKSKGSLVSTVARGFLELYNKLARDRVKNKYLDFWEDNGEKLVILKGLHHKHLQYLADELYYAAIETHRFYQKWSKTKVLLVLSVLGREEDIEDCFEGLSELR